MFFHRYVALTLEQLSPDASFFEGVYVYELATHDQITDNRVLGCRIDQFGTYQRARRRVGGSATKCELELAGSDVCLVIATDNGVFMPNLTRA